MIQLNRVRALNSIHKKYTSIDKESADYILLVAYLEWLNNNQKKINFDSSYWKNSKTQLKKEAYQKCAYCETNTQVVAHGDVEHYRPKSEYWWLAYTYDNYLYSCQICNQIHKKIISQLLVKNYPPLRY